jgi:hypothetical protein
MEEPKNTDKPMLTEAEKLQRKRLYNKQLREANIAKGLTGAGKPRKRPFRPRTASVPHYQTKAYRRDIYRRQVERYRQRGLNASGKPYRRISAAGKRSIAKAQKLRREREKAQLNGMTAPQAAPTDSIGESARAILVAAQVLRSVSVGLKL